MFSCIATLASTLVVAASGGGDFSELQAAVDAASDGDVLLVEPGTYGPFTTSKALTIVGPAAGPKPLVLGHSEVTGSRQFALGGLELERLTVRNVPGHTTIDACSIHSPTQWGLGVFDCNRVQVERCVIEADTAYHTQGQSAALLVEGSGLHLVDSTLTGPDSAAGEIDYTDGGQGLLAIDSDVRVVSSHAFGGRGGAFASLFSFCEPGGSGFRVQGGSLALQGIGHLSEGDVGGVGCAHGVSIYATNGALVVHQGYVLPDGVTVLNGAQVIESYGTPSMRLAGNDEPGKTRRLLVSAAHSQPVILFGSLGSASLTLPGLEGLVGIDSASIVYVGATLGQKLIKPSTVPFEMPPSLAGLEGVQLHIQGVAPLTYGVYDPSASALTNPVTLLVRF
ncbi:MAG: hypothetical protein GC161_05295 [Planctomycetaceae bacterium]|nr:hypothetical protein [Planctomycetaceae bacterium]